MTVRTSGLISFLPLMRLLSLLNQYCAINAAFIQHSLILLFAEFLVLQCIPIPVPGETPQQCLDEYNDSAISAYRQSLPQCPTCGHSTRQASLMVHMRGCCSSQLNWQVTTNRDSRRTKPAVSQPLVCMLYSQQQQSIPRPLLNSPSTRLTWFICLTPTYGTDLQYSFHLITALRG